MLENKDFRNGRRTPAVASARLRELPRDRERDVVLLEDQIPQRDLNDIILDAKNRCTVEEVLREQRRRDVLRTHHIRPRQRLLFSGPPGCGKSLCAEVIAFELGLPLLVVRFDAVISSFLGETAANLRKVFDFAKRGEWVLLLDDFDAIGKRRDDPTEHGELKRLVNTFLQLIDGFRSDNLVIATTNHEGLLDPALWRRFDEILHFGLPSREQIHQLLELRLASVRHSTISLSRVAPKLVGMSHADIERICYDAMRGVVLDGASQLSTEALDRAIEDHKQRLAIASGENFEVLFPLEMRR